jgi:hypothetical protein
VYRDATRALNVSSPPCSAVRVASLAVSPLEPPDRRRTPLTALVHLDVHPDVDQPVFRGLVFPERPLWTPSQLRTLTSTVAADFADVLHGTVRYTAPDRWWTRLALTRGLELWLLSWLPSQGTVPHDHGGAAGSFSVLRGAVEEEYRYPGAPIRTQRLRAGQGVGFGGGRAHRVHNPVGSAPAVTVHAYSPPLLPTREYQSLEEVR